MVFTGRFVRADEALAIGLVDELVPAADVYARHGPRPSRSPTGPRWRTRRRRRRSTAGWTSTCGRGWTWSPELFAGCSRPRTSASGWSRSSRTGRARRSSPAADLGGGRSRGRPPRRTVAGASDPRQATSSTTTGAPLERSGRSPRRALITTPATASGSPRRCPTPPGDRQRTGSSCQPMQARRVGQGSVTDLSPGMVEVACATPGARSRRGRRVAARSGSPTRASTGRRRCAPSPT